MRDLKYALVIAGFVFLFMMAACGEQPAPPAPPVQPAQPAQPEQPAQPAQPEVGAASASAVAPVFQKNCVPCHGADGKGNKAISPKMPDFTDAAWQAKENDDELIKSVTDGIGEGRGSMPAWKEKFSADEIKSLVAHVREFAKK